MAPIESGRIRVLHLITRLIVGGAQENTMYTAACLDPGLYQVEILSGGQTGSEGSLIEDVRDRGIPLTILYDLRREVRPWHDLFALCKMARWMRQNHFTIVHTHSSKAGILGRLAARLAGIPIIVHTVHGWSFHGHMPAMVRKVFVLSERLAARHTDVIIAVTQQDVDKGLRERIGHPGQYHVIRSAIPLNEFDPTCVDRAAIRLSLGIPIDAPVLGNVGRFSRQKNPLDWVRVAGRVGRELPDCYFLLVGDGPLKNDIQLLLVEEGLQGRTVLTGIRHDVAQLLGAMDVFLLTSLWEGLPRVIPQAMRMKLPIVANAVDGAVEVIHPGETGYLCTPGSLGEIADRCVQLLRDRELRQNIGEQGYSYATREFDLHEMIAKIDHLYRGLLSSKGMWAKG